VKLTLTTLATAISLIAADVKECKAKVSDYVTNGLLCIHSHEASWGANTGNGYYGGLQMDYNFQRTYGSWALRRYGTANNWPVSVQLAVGRRGYNDRGWKPWPATARMCGLY
jgi:hypothetical protein